MVENNQRNTTGVKTFIWEVIQEKLMGNSDVDRDIFLVCG